MPDRRTLWGNPTTRAALIETISIVVGGLLLYSLVPMVGSRWWMGLVAAIVASLLVIPVTARRLAHIRRSSRPIIDAVEAVVLLLTVIALGFASTYVVLNDRQGQMTGISTKIDALYFSVTTLTTVGFGDIHATGQAARVAVTIQMVIDLVFIAAAFKLIGGVARDRAAALEAEARGETRPNSNWPRPD